MPNDAPEKMSNWAVTLSTEPCISPTGGRNIPTAQSTTPISRANTAHISLTSIRTFSLYAPTFGLVSITPAFTAVRPSVNTRVTLPFLMLRAEKKFTT